MGYLERCFKICCRELINKKISEEQEGEVSLEVRQQHMKIDIV